MPQLTWDQVLANRDLIGGDIESKEDGGHIFRGPLCKIEEEGPSIRFTSPWIARFNTTSGQWEKWDVTTSSAPKAIPPQDIGDGRIFFTMPFFGHCTIFPKSGSKLQANTIKGLQPASRRFLALYPDLRFDREVAKKVMGEQHFVNAFILFAKKPEDATMQDLLECFSSDNSAEEFLWHYVAAITGEKDPYLRVY